MPAIDGEHVVPALERAVGQAGSPTPYTDVHRSTSQPSAMMQSMQRTTETLKVSTHSRPSAVAGAIAGVMRQHGEVDVQAIGAGATNQAIKAIAIACSYLRDDDMEVCCVPSFIDVIIDDQERTAIRLLVQQYTKSGNAPVQPRPEPR